MHVRGSPIVLEQTGTRLGVLHDLAFDASTGALLALRVQWGLLAPVRKYLLLRDVAAWEPHRIVVSDPAALCDAEELVRVSDDLARAFPWIGLPVRTLSGTRVGRVSDVAFHSVLGHAERLHVATGLFFSAQRVIALSQVRSIEPSGVIVEDACIRARAKRLRIALPLPSSARPADLPPSSSVHRT